ncbi:jg25660 [Pararge aegeria aegeria]|uniref:Jg25660 protein n=1 Tax=Pararge aegeria aegeria TaxID=348720 RepID=A0A8S4QHK7_9NEOP|nr:jg25660 [Pararge aegeria aegeria]
MSNDRRPLLDIGLLKGVPNSTVLCRLCPAAPRDALDVICPLSAQHWRPTLCLPMRGHHSSLGTPTSIRSSSYVPRPLPLQLCDSLSYVGNSGSSTDLLISDLITQRYSELALSIAR